MLVEQVDRSVCRDLLPIIPIQEIEAWLLADKEALLKELKMNQSTRTSDMPSAQRIGSIARPEEQLEQSIRAVNNVQRRSISRKELYKPLGETVRLARLTMLSTSRQCVADLTEALTNLGIISLVSLCSTFFVSIHGSLIFGSLVKPNTMAEYWPLLFEQTGLCVGFTRTGRTESSSLFQVPGDESMI